MPSVVGEVLGLLPVREMSSSRTSSCPPAEAGLVGREVGITGPTSLPTRRSNKTLACRKDLIQPTDKNVHAER